MHFSQLYTAGAVFDTQRMRSGVVPSFVGRLIVRVQTRGERETGFLNHEGTRDLQTGGNHSDVEGPGQAAAS